MNTPQPAPQDPIDQALQTLRQAQPTLGMEAMQQRLLHRLATTPAPKPRRTLAEILLAPRAAWATAALAATALTITFALHHTAPTPSHSPSPYVATTHALTSLLPTRPCPLHRASCDERDNHQTTPEPQSPNPEFSRQPAVPAPEIATATPAPALLSFPAPPLPLTPQEQLLLHLAHHATPGELANLGPAQHDPGNDFAGLDPLSAPPLPTRPQGEPLTPIDAPPPAPHAAPAMSLVAAALINFSAPVPPPERAPGADPTSTSQISSQTQSGDSSWPTALK